MTLFLDPFFLTLASTKEHKVLYLDMRTRLNSNYAMCGQNVFLQAQASLQACNKFYHKPWQVMAPGPQRETLPLSYQKCQYSFLFWWQWYPVQALQQQDNRLRSPKTIGQHGLRHVLSRRCLKGAAQASCWTSQWIQRFNESSRKFQIMVPGSMDAHWKWFALMLDSIYYQWQIACQNTAAL